MQRTEHPFGLGFLQSLYAAGSCAVESSGQRVRFDTRAALDGATVDVERGNDARGTTVTLEDVELPEIEREIVRMTRGFPIAVQYNGVVLRRPHAPDACRTSRPRSARCIWRGGRTGGDARDRGVSAGPDESRGRGGRWLRVQRRASRSGAVPGAASRPRSSDGSGGTAPRGGEGARDAVAGSPDRSEAGRRARGIHRAVLPRGEDVGACRCLQRRAAAPRGRAPAGGRVSAAGCVRRQGFLVPFRRPVCPKRSRRAGACGSHACPSSTSERARAWMYARERACFVFDEWSLEPGHWAHGYVRMLEEEPVSMEAVNPGPRSPRGASDQGDGARLRGGRGQGRGRSRGHPGRCGVSPGDNTILVPENESRGRRCARSRTISTARATGARRTSMRTPRRLRRRSRFFAAPIPRARLLRLHRRGEARALSELARQALHRRGGRDAAGASRRVRGRRVEAIGSRRPGERRARRFLARRSPRALGARRRRRSWRGSFREGWTR